VRLDQGTLGQHLQRHPVPHQQLTLAGPARRAALGVRAEEVARAHLVERGLELVARNLRVGRLELDLVLRDGALIVVVEVRTRGAGSFQRALDSVDSRKRARVRAAGERLWRERFARDASVDRMRFDIAAVEFQPDGTAVVEHIKAAF
jgi:putative endonuclease